MAAGRPHVLSVPAGCPFLPTLVDALVEGRLIAGFPADPMALADATIYLPTRRAARALTSLLADRADGQALLLPRIVPLGETDEAEFDLSSTIGGFDDPDVVSPPISPVERRLILTRLVQRWSAEVDRDLLRLGPGIPFMVPASPADAVNLAGDLEALMDAFTNEGVPWDGLAAAVEADYSTYFEITLKFVRIAADNWPKILADRKASDPARRRNALIAAEAERLARERPSAPIIAAGSTGTLPATASLLAAIARLPRGAVVLPGLDQHLDEESWDAIARNDETDLVHGHPQGSLRRLLEHQLGMKRAEVDTLGAPTEAASARGRMLSEALRPADTTDRWALLPNEERLALGEAGCRGLALIEAADERDEALAIAVALRETLTEPGRTAALVTPDRTLATRVVAELARWDLEVEDSAGVPLTESQTGRLARLAADAAALDFHPVRVLALLAHPQVRLGWERHEVARAAAILEIGVLRGPAPAAGLDGLCEALEACRTDTTRRLSLPARRLTEADWDCAAALLERLTVAFGGFTAEALGEDALDLVRVAERHRDAVDALRAAPDGVEDDEDASTEALAALFDDLALSDVGAVEGRFVDYPAFFTTLAKLRTLSASPRATHRRLKILGPLEARLLGVDRVVLGGLDEGVWPPRAETDAFLNRPMRSRIGLSPPERRIGQTAHDFVQALGCPDAVITRAAKRDGKPMVPSRFLQRLKAFSGDAAWERMTAAGDRYRRFARILDTPQPAPPLPRPAPRPDPALFPRSLSVTEIETLVRDPYSIFGRHILKLEALEPLAGSPDAARRGTLIHAVLGSFAEAYPQGLPAHALEDLLARGEDAFAPIEKAFPELYAEWWPRFQRLATAYVVWEQSRRLDLAEIFPERSGALTITLPDGTPFTLRARADRIEQRRDGAFAIIDFKTGQPPGLKEVFAGFSPQLTLEAMMLMKGAFNGIPAAAATPDLLYIHTSGGRTPLDPRRLDPPRGETRSLAELVEEHRVKFEGMIARYASGEMPYRSRPFAKYARRFSDYDHLARVKEWSQAGAGEDGDA